MSRPSRNQDKKMLDVGKQLFRKKGFSGLTIMEVCHQAGVNQGMFVYYFKNKDNFSRIVFAEVYKEFFDELKAPESIGTPLDQLRQAIKTIAKYVARNKDLFKSIMRDVLSGEKEVQNIIKKHAPKDLKYMFALIDRCQKEGYIRKDVSKFEVFSMIQAIPMSIFPIIMGDSKADKILDAVGMKERSVDKLIDARFDILLKGLKR